MKINSFGHRAGDPKVKSRVSGKYLHILKCAGLLFQDRQRQWQNTCLVTLSCSFTSRVHKKLKNQTELRLLWKELRKCLLFPSSQMRWYFFQMSLRHLVIGHLEFGRAQSSGILLLLSSWEAVGFGWSCWLDCLPKQLNVENEIMYTDGRSKTPMNHSELQGREPVQSKFGSFPRSAVWKHGVWSGLLYAVPR